MPAYQMYQIMLFGLLFHSWLFDDSLYSCAVREEKKSLRGNTGGETQMLTFSGFWLVCSLNVWEQRNTLIYTVKHFTSTFPQRFIWDL